MSLTPPSHPPQVQAAVAASAGLLTIPDLYINLANVSLASEDYTDALRLYKVAMGKLDANKQSQVRGRGGREGGAASCGGGQESKRLGWAARQESTAGT